MSTDEEKRGTECILSEEQDCCPICLADPSDDDGVEFALSGTCPHAFCIPCAERILLTNKTWDAGRPQVAATTVGLCPVCRVEMHYFDLRRANDPSQILFPKNHDIHLTPLAGSRFNASDESITITFPKNEYSRPQIGLIASGAVEGSNTELFDFEGGCHFHAKTNTFHGTVSFVELEEPQTSPSTSWPDLYAKCDFILQFAPDCRSISHGTIVKHCRDGFHPLDGNWKVTWLHVLPDREEPLSAFLSVCSSKFSLGYLYHLKFSEDRQGASFTWPIMFGVPFNILQTTTFDFEANPHGPAVGEDLEWTTTHPVQNRIRWTRMRMVELPRLETDLIGFGRNKMSFRRINGRASSSGQSCS